MYSEGKFSIWCPLVGFDLYSEDKGVAEYLEKIGSKPHSIALFVFNPDLMYMHQGMDKEVLLPKDCGNYYGAERNEIRSIQPWTNLALRDLVSRLKAEGIKVYFSFMGMHTVPRDLAQVKGGLFGYVAQQKFLIEHEECCIEGKPWDGHTYFPKRMKDGTYFADFFAKTAVRVLSDYGADGIHLADAIFPPCMQAQEGDFSYDLMERFEIFLGSPLPYGMTKYVEDSEFNKIANRADWIWANLREKWLEFLSECWKNAIKSVADELHANGMDLMTCNAWTSEPFEAYYRYGIDYAKVAKAGIDYMALEQQATTTFLVDARKTYIDDWERYSCSMLTKAYAPETTYFSMNFVKDSTEEASTVSHMPVATEREIHLYMDWYLLGDKLKRASSGYFICLGDALKKSEWDLVISNYEKVFKEEPVDYLGAVIGWSDRQINTFLPEYLKGRRWSAHKLLASVNRKGASIMGLCEIDKLNSLKKDVFIPNADLLTDAELERINSLEGVGIVLTTVRGAEQKLSKLVGFEKFYDEGVNEDEFQSVVYVKSNNVCAKDLLSGIDFGQRLPYEDMSKLADTRIWAESILFRTVSDGFISFIAKVIRNMNYARYGISLSNDCVYTLLKMGGDKYRIIVSNSTLYHYGSSKVYVNSKIKSLENIMSYPIQATKLIMEGEAVTAQDAEGKRIKDAIGFLVKFPPGGIGIVDFCLE
ncbi:MAG: hypothetical protein IKC83_02385 [Clostridia bacterium]|nr:hypothetical protein [Clostridia bacterium]